MMRPSAGLGFKPEYLDEVLACPAAGAWYEIHAENYMIDGGLRLAMLETLRSIRPLSVHGVGLSLAADAPPDPDHLARLKRLVNRVEPFVVSEHLAWSVWSGTYFPDLLPFPRSQAALDRIARNIEITQSVLGRRVLIENPSLYVQLPGHEMAESEFLSELTRRTGCGLLVDINNAYVSACNLGFDAGSYLAALPAQAVEEIHLAGHAADSPEPEALLIDTHGAPIAEPVWALYASFIDRVGLRPTLIERDSDLPPFAELCAERDRADRLLAARVSALPERAEAHV
jgi:uncharacterized protein